MLDVLNFLVLRTFLKRIIMIFILFYYFDILQLHFGGGGGGVSGVVGPPQASVWVPDHPLLKGQDQGGVRQTTCLDKAL
jgi:hypothetical protein